VLPGDPRLMTCPICGMEDPERLRLGVGVVMWRGWPAHDSCYEWLGRGLLPSGGNETGTPHVSGATMSGPLTFRRDGDTIVAEYAADAPQWTRAQLESASQGDAVAALRAGLLRDLGYAAWQPLPPLPPPARAAP